MTFNSKRKSSAITITQSIFLILKNYHFDGFMRQIYLFVSYSHDKCSELTVAYPDGDYDQKICTTGRT